MRGCPVAEQMRGGNSTNRTHVVVLVHAFVARGSVMIAGKSFLMLVVASLAGPALGIGLFVLLHAY